MGSSIGGAPGIVNIGFNDNIAWTHTFSTAEHAIAYQLTLDPNDTSGMTYVVDGVSKPIVSRVFTVDVQVAPSTVIPFQKTMYFSDIAENALRTNPVLIQTRKQAGFSVLPGNSAVFDFADSVPYEKAPKLSRQDFVQNSNDSYWLTNPAEPIGDVSILYGKRNNEQTFRSRMGQKMLQDAAGTDGKFSVQELEAALFSERSLLGEEIRDDLLTQCQAQGTTPVVVNDQSIDISPACNALAQWDGHTDTTSRAAHLFREFAQQFMAAPQWQVPFDPLQPTTTPNTFNANATTLQQLAQAMLRVQSAGLALDAPLGDVQFVERTFPNGTPTGERLPWSGGNNVEGGFNVFRPVFAHDGSLIPRHIYPPITGSQLSAVGKGYQIAYGSSWMMTVRFTNKGPEARGLMSMSQSVNSASPHSIDQTHVYSESPQLHDIPFHEQDIAAHTEEDISISSGGH